MRTPHGRSGAGPTAEAARAGRPTAEAARPRTTPPNARMERQLRKSGHQMVAGLDEVGRGAWAGPVSVGVVVFPFDRRPPAGIRDSKQLSEPRREELYPLVDKWCTEWAVGHADPRECDLLGMTRALRLAARRALGSLEVAPQVVLMDGDFDYVSDPDPACCDGPAIRTVVRGDATCVSVAAASIMAKVTRDRMMRSWAESFPAFDFDQNKGYPSPVHRTALSGFGLTSLHRRSWSYVDELAFR